MQTRVALIIVLANCILLGLSPDGDAGDWPMFGRDATRNAVSPETDPPTQWDVESGKNIRWTAALGSNTTGTPVVADGLVWVGTNNDRRERTEQAADASVLACFRESDGELLYRYVSPRLKAGWTVDCPQSSMGSSPLVEEDRLWFVTNRFEVVCLDIKPLRNNAEEPRRVWTLDMIEELGITPVGPYMGWTHRCSVAGYRDWIYVITGHGSDEWTGTPASPHAASLICVDKRTGKVVWEDKTPGENILYGQCASPLVIEINGRPQCIAPQGDGWVRSFDALTGKLIWEFYLNLKTTHWRLGGGGDRNNILATPVLYEDRIYIANGRNTEQGEGPGRLVCIDPTGTGDISSELAVDADGNSLPRRRLQAVIDKQGERTLPNPNSGLIWEFTVRGDNGTDQMYRAIASVAVDAGLVVAPDSSGFIHCLDALNGTKYWTFDAFAYVYATPLICDNKIFIADYDGNVTMLELSRELKELGEHYLDSGIYSSPIFANGTLYIASMKSLHAISANQDKGVATKGPGGYWPNWRGPLRNNKSDETGLLQEWPEDGPPLIWRAEGVGEGICPVSIAGGRVYLISRHEDQEYVVALDEVSGSHLWTKHLGRTIPQNALMQWMTQRSPTVDVDRVYAVSALGDLACLRTSDGHRLWQTNYEEHLNGKRGPWGIGDRPLVEGDKLIVSPGGAGTSVVALDKLTGQEIWRCAVGDSARGSYGAGIVTEIAGTRQLVTSSGSMLVGIDVVDGHLLWQAQKDISDRTNQLTPLAHERHVLFPFGYQQRCVALEIVSTGDGLQANTTSDSRVRLDPFHDSTFLLGNHLYVYGQITSCYDWRTGVTVWQKRVASARRIAATYADGRAYLRNTEGLMILMQATPEALDEKGRFTIPDPQRQAGATFPVVTGGRLYLRDNDRLFCYDVSAEAQPSPADPNTIVLEPLKQRTAQTSRQRPRTGVDRAPDAVFVATPQDVVEKMLELAGVTKADVVCDLGSGDGRIVMTAARKYQAKAVGYEIDAELVQLSRGKIKKQKLIELATVEHRDFFTVDLSSADVITVFLQPPVLERLRPQLKMLRPGSRIVSHFFAIPGVRPDKTIEFESADDNERHTLHLWTLPLKDDSDE